MEDKIKIKFNKNDIKKNDIFSIMKLSLIIIIPFIVLFVLIFSYISKTQIETSVQLIIGEQKHRANTIDRIITDIYTESIEDLLIIKNSDEIKSYLDDKNSYNLNEVGQMFYRFASTKKNFDQIRILNTDGFEILRINNDTDEPEIVDSENLQDKSHTSYYKATLGLEENHFYISDMDLNIENNMVEFPKKPIIRLSTPLYIDGKIDGLFVINYLGSGILDILNEQFHDTEYDFIEHFLLNENGYYLYNDDFDKTFSFMYDAADQHNFTINYPEIFEKVLSTDNGYLEKDDRVYFYKRIMPTQNVELSDNEHCCWYYVSFFDLSSLPIVDNLFISYLTVVDFIVLLGLIALIFYLVFVIYFRNKEREQLTLTTKIAENTNDAILITDYDTKIIFVNKSFEEITGYTAQEVIGLKTNYFKSGLHSHNFYEKMWDSIKNEGKWSGEVWDRKKDGLFYPKLLNIFAVKTKFSEKVDKYIGIYSDLTRIKESEANINKLKNYNIETDLPNENLLKKLVDLSVLENENKPFGLFCFSITNFNDLIFDENSLGHNDKINEFINAIHGLISKEDFVAQISKNTFAIGLVSHHSKSEVENFCRLFFRMNRELIKRQAGNFYFEIKAGVSIYPDDDITSDGLLTSASIALEAAKGLKTKDYVFSSPKLKEQINKEMKMHLLLRKSIQNDELDVNYQPQVNNNTGKIEGAEALLRWNNRELGNISPFFFIPIAEKNGFIIELGYWLIDRVFHDFKKIEDKLPEDFKISINVSPVQFQDGKLLNKFQSLSEKHSVDLRKFEVEITESILVSDVNVVNMKLQEFKRLGLSIALDDFGTGFSSLSYLKNLDFDKIKIDRSFIKDYPESDNGGIAKVIVQIAKEFDLKVITEGAETQEQIDYLKSIECKYIQGYYYSRPLNFKDFEEYVIEHS